MPKYRVFKTGADEDAYLKQLGYKISTDEDSGKVRALVLGACCPAEALPLCKAWRACCVSWVCSRYEATPLPLTAPAAPCIAFHAAWLAGCLQVDRESTDEFVGRMQGYLMLYAAVMQVGDSPLPGCSQVGGWL